MNHHVYHIVATSGNVLVGESVIGKGNQLPWPRNPKDMKFFREMTEHSTVIMGRRTFESIGKKLPNRENFVVSRADFPVPEGVRLFHSVQDAIRGAATEKVFIIGGGEVYRQTVQNIDGIYWTPMDEVYGRSFEGDVRYPLIPKSFEINEKESKELEAKYGLPIVCLEKTPAGK